MIDIPTLFYYLYVVSGATLRKEDDSYNSLYRQSFQYSMGHAVLYANQKKETNSFFCKYLTGECMIVVQCNSEQFVRYIRARKKVIYKMMMMSALYPCNFIMLVDRNNTSWVAPFGHIILIPSKPVFVLT